jgi:putative membrane protein
MKKPEFIKIVKLNKGKRNEKRMTGKNIRRAACLGVALAVFVSTVNTHTVMATAEKEYEESEENLLTNVVINETGEGSKDADKEETVYLITNASGNVEETIVSEWLKNKEGAAEIKDATNLSNIENVKGDETYSQGEGENITWNAAGSDIYYQGATTQASPIDMKITYYLNGQEISPENLAGQSGKVTIRMDYQNNAKEKITIDGEEEEIYVPFTVVSGMILPVDTFSNVEVTNGKIVSDGNRNIIVGVAMPGLKESIDPDGKLEKEDSSLEIPEYVEVTADVEDFALDMTLSVAMPDILSDFKFSDTIDLTELEESMDELNDASAKLVDGTGSLKDGTDSLEDGTGELKTGMGDLNNGIAQYTAGVSELTGGLNQLKNGSSTLAGGAAQVSDGVNTLATGLNGLTSALETNIQTQTANQAACQEAVAADTKAVTSELTTYTTNVATVAGNTAAEAAANAAAKATAEATASAVASALQNGQTLSDEQLQQIVEKAVAGVLKSEVAQASLTEAVTNAVQQKASSDGVSAAVTKLAEDSGNLGGATGALTALTTISSQADLSKLPQLVQGAQAVADGAATLNNGIQSALDGANKLNGSSAALKDGSTQLVNGVDKLNTGANELSDGAEELNSGMIEFDEEGIQKLTGTLDGDVSSIIDRIDAVFDAGDNYSTFTKLADGQEGRVKFIIRTGSVK